MIGKNAQGEMVNPPGHTPSPRPHQVGHPIENNYTYHPPFGNQAERYERIRSIAKLLAEVIEEECPGSREKALAHTNLEQAVMWANAAIARNEKRQEEI